MFRIWCCKALNTSHQILAGGRQHHSGGHFGTGAGEIGCGIATRGRSAPRIAKVCCALVDGMTHARSHTSVANWLHFGYQIESVVCQGFLMTSTLKPFPAILASFSVAMNCVAKPSSPGLFCQNLMRWFQLCRHLGQRHPTSGFDGEFARCDIPAEV